MDGQKTAIKSPGKIVTKEKSKKKITSPAEAAKSFDNKHAKSSTDSRLAKSADSKIKALDQKWSK